MLAHIYGLALELDALGLEALPHYVGGLEMHFPGEFAEAIHHAMAGDVDPVAVRHGVQGPADEPGAPAGSNRRGDVSVGGDLPPWDCTDDVVDALVDVGCHPTR